MKKLKIITIISLFLTVSSFASEERLNSDNIKSKEMAQHEATRFYEEFSITPEQRAEIEEQAAIMFEGMKQASSREEQQQLRQNFQMALAHILTEEQMAIRRQKKEEIKAQRRKFQQ